MVSPNPYPNSARVTDDRPPSPWILSIRTWLLERVWYVHAPIYFSLNLNPNAILPLLKTAAKPSIERLHLRNVFASGRRYYVHPEKSGFSMTSTAKVVWRYSQRTTATTILTANINTLPDGTRLEVQSHIRLPYLMSAFLIPTFVSSIIVYMPWNNLVTMLFVGLLYAFSWIGHRYQAALEGYEMVYFLEKALEDFISTPSAELQSQGAYVVGDSAKQFHEAWKNFYKEVVHPPIEPPKDTDNFDTITYPER
jgi:hypothetical protein